jgi:hypothetical protein
MARAPTPAGSTLRSDRAQDRRATDLLRNAQVAPLEVDDPMEMGGKLIVMRSTRDDPLADLHARHMIDEAQYRAAGSFQGDFETAERGPKAIDFTREAVDGGQMPEPITEAQRKAAKQLAVVYRALGQDGAALTHDVLVHSKTRAQVAASRGLTGKSVGRNTTAGDSGVPGLHGDRLRVCDAVNRSV